MHPISDPNRVLPVCTNECSPRKPPGKDEVAPTRTVRFRQVTHVFSCMRQEQLPVDVHLEKQSPNSEAKRGGNKKSPKAVKAHVSLGGEPFQVRALVVATGKGRESSRMVRLGLWGRPSPESSLERLKNLGGFAFAQAEYYYDGDDGRDAWMWNMNWRGRLKRFELPKADKGYEALEDACRREARSGKNCSQVLQVLKDWQELLVH
ncbi:MAG: hypothetical protein QM784_30420 [Polyangiaceae bacterium]